MDDAGGGGVLGAVEVTIVCGAPTEKPMVALPLMDSKSRRAPILNVSDFQTRWYIYESFVWKEGGVFGRIPPRVFIHTRR